MSEELSGVTVVIIIGMGALTLILLFIFAKRQIMRFALRSRRSPHVPIGHDANKILKREIERRIEQITKIINEPLVMSKCDSRYIIGPGEQVPIHYWRLKAVDDVNILENEIKHEGICRHPSENLRVYLLSVLAAPLNGSGQRIIHQFCDLYEHARHDPRYFGDEEYQQYNRLLLKLTDAAKLLKLYNSKKSSPIRTPQKKPTEKNRDTLDPAKLHKLPFKYAVSEDDIVNIDSRPTTFSVTLATSENETSV